MRRRATTRRGFHLIAHLEGSRIGVSVGHYLPAGIARQPCLPPESNPTPPEPLLARLESTIRAKTGFYLSEGSRGKSCPGTAPAAQNRRHDHDHVELHEKKWRHRCRHNQDRDQNNRSFISSPVAGVPPRRRPTGPPIAVSRMSATSVLSLTAAAWMASPKMLDDGSQNSYHWRCSCSAMLAASVFNSAIVGHVLTSSWKVIICSSVQLVAWVVLSRPWRDRSGIPATGHWPTGSHSPGRIPGKWSRCRCFCRL